MAVEAQKAGVYTHARIFQEKAKRIRKVARRLSAKLDADVYATDLTDEILEEGLSKREKALGLKV